MGCAGSKPKPPTTATTTTTTTTKQAEEEPQNNSVALVKQESAAAVVAVAAAPSLPAGPKPKSMSSQELVLGSGDVKSVRRMEQRDNVMVVDLGANEEQKENNSVDGGIAVSEGATEGDSAQKPLRKSDSLQQKLTKEEVVLYPSAKAALNAKGLGKYSAALEAKGVIQYQDLAYLTEDFSDPFWNQMPPFPDRKKFRTLIEEVQVIFDVEPGTVDDQPSDVDEKTAVDAKAAVDKKKIAEMQTEAKTDAPASAEKPSAAVVEEEMEEDAPPPVPREKTAVPCNEYETDVYAADFGVCLCGHPKKAHNSSSAAKGPSYAQRTPSKRAVEASAPTDGGVCFNYAIDVTAKDFGTCVCGYPKAAHNASASGGTNKFKAMAKGSFNKGSPRTENNSTRKLQPVTNPTTVAAITAVAAVTVTETAVELPAEVASPQTNVEPPVVAEEASVLETEESHNAPAEEQKMGKGEEVMEQEANREQQMTPEQPQPAAPEGEPKQVEEESPQEAEPALSQANEEAENEPEEEAVKIEQQPEPPKDENDEAPPPMPLKTKVSTRSDIELL